MRVGLRDVADCRGVELGVPSLVDLGEVEGPALGVDLGSFVYLNPTLVMETRSMFERRRDRSRAERPLTPGASQLRAVRRVVHLAHQRPTHGLAPGDHRPSCSSSTRIVPRMTAQRWYHAVVTMRSVISSGLNTDRLRPNAASSHGRV